MKRLQYLISRSTKQEKIVWVCGQCKKDNMDAILLGYWRLIGQAHDSIPCDVCGVGSPKIDNADPPKDHNKIAFGRFS